MATQVRPALAKPDNPLVGQTPRQLTDKAQARGFHQGPKDNRSLHFEAECKDAVVTEFPCRNMVANGTGPCKQIIRTAPTPNYADGTNNALCGHPVVYSPICKPIANIAGPNAGLSAAEPHLERLSSTLTGCLTKAGADAPISRAHTTHPSRISNYFISFTRGNTGVTNGNNKGRITLPNDPKTHLCDAAFVLLSF